MGHIAKNFPATREEYKKRNRRQHAHTIEDEEPPTKMIKEQIEDYVDLDYFQHEMREEI
jgi:hypothetical protein